MLKNLFKRNHDEKSNTSSKRQTDSKDEMWITIMSPLSGDVLPIEQVDDPAFAKAMVGDGVALQPTSSTVVAPVAGTLTNLFPTGHAAGITTPEGIEVLVHVGLDTVELKGAGFTMLAKQGDKVKVGTPLLELNLDQLRKTARSLATPVIITSMTKIEKLVKTNEVAVEAGQDWVLRVLPSKN